MDRVWRLEIVDWGAIQTGVFGGDRFCNTTVKTFFGLSAVWDYLGFHLKRQRCGYSGLKGNKEYILTRLN